MQAIVLAGQENVALKSVSDCTYEGEVLVAGRPMLHWVVNALLAATSIERVIVVGPAAIIPEHPKVVSAEVGDTMWDSLDSGLGYLREDVDRVLIVTGDIPLISGPMIDAFVASAPMDADLVYPVVTKVRTLEKYPDTKRTYVRLAQGMVVTGGNLALANPRTLPQIEARAKLLISHRKSPWRLAQDLGLMLLLRFVTGRLTIVEAERRVSAIFGIKGRVLECPYPEIGVDVDKPSDLILVEKVLGTPGRSSTESRAGG